MNAGTTRDKFPGRHHSPAASLSRKTPCEPQAQPPNRPLRAWWGGETKPQPARRKRKSRETRMRMGRQGQTLRGGSIQIRKVTPWVLIEDKRFRLLHTGAESGTWAGGTVIMRALRGEIKQHARPRPRHEPNQQARVFRSKFTIARGNPSRNCGQLLSSAPHALLVYHAPRSFYGGIHAPLCGSGSQHNITDGTGVKSGYQW